MSRNQYGEAIFQDGSGDLPPRAVEGALRKEPGGDLPPSAVEGAKHKGRNQ